MELRQRQLECLESIRNEYMAGTYQQLVVAATGTGKAVIIANLRRKMHTLAAAAGCAVEGYAYV